jgi:hypothetical protein
MTDDQTTGTVAELNAQVVYKKSGYNVLTPVRGDQPYDFVAEKDGKFRRVQVKNGRYDSEQGSIDVHVCVYSGGEAHIYTSEDIDEFAVYCESLDSTYVVGVEEAPSQNMRLRVKESTSPSVRWAEEYTWDKQL